MSKINKLQEARAATLLVVAAPSGIQDSDERFEALKMQYKAMLKRQDEQLEKSEKLVEAVYG